MSAVEIRDYRYERKFLVDEMDAGQARLLIKCHPAMFLVPFPPRHINNLYLDTRDLQYYYANVDGADERCKVRIRWYGGLYGNISQPMLEFKIKSGLVCTKHVYPFPPFCLDDAFCDAVFQDIVRRADLPESVRRTLRDLEIVLCNRYYRWYFASQDQRYRVTVDEGMAYYHVSRGASLSQHRFLDDRNIIIELKYDKPFEKAADRVAGFFPFIVTKNSKYVTGIERVYL